MRAGIETEYRGIRFRSRLEARWAAFFDAIGWSYIYEPFDGHGYIPDFLITGPSPLVVEVRPVATEDEYRAQVETMRLDPTEAHYDLLIVGLSPIMHTWSSYLFMGWMGEWIPHDSWDQETGEETGPPEWVWEAGTWQTCIAPDCDQVAVRHWEMTWRNQPCGHYSGDGYLGEPPDLMALWAEACNATRWTRS